MLDLLEKIFRNVLLVVYEHTGFSLTLAVLFMFAFMYAKENGIRNSIKKWIAEFKGNAQFRKVFLLIFYMAMMFNHTLFNREMYVDPLKQILGGWGFYDENGAFTTESMENIILFIPLVIFVFCAFEHKFIEYKMNFYKAVIGSVSMAAGVSFVIEFCQLFLRLGTFQFADLVYNTLGGLIGGLIYWLIYKIIHAKK